MPKSKRDKEVSLTKVKKKGKMQKEKLINEVRRCIDAYENVFVFDVANMRSSKLSSVRCEWKDDTKLIYGKNKVIALALGRIPEEEYAPNLHRISKFLLGQCGLIFTNRSKEDVVNYFKAYCEPDYARAGNIASMDVELTAGPLDQFQHSMEPQLRKLGLPTRLDKGVVTLAKDFSVCKEGDILTPEQAKILKLLGYQMVDFKVNVRCMWTKKDNKFLSLGKKSKKADTMDCQ